MRKTQIYKNNLNNKHKQLKLYGGNISDLDFSEDWGVSESIQRSVKPETDSKEDHGELDHSDQSDPVDLQQMVKLVEPLAGDSSGDGLQVVWIDCDIVVVSHHEMHCLIAHFYYLD